MTIRVGIIGCGKIAQVRHIPEYVANPHAEIRGFYDLNTKRAQELAEKLKTMVVKVQAKAGSNGRLFGSITAADISAALKKQFNIEIDRHKMTIDESIKQFGTYEVKVKLYNEVSGVLRVSVCEA